MDPPQPGTIRWAVLEALTSPLQKQWTAPQLAVHTELGLGTVIRALGALRELGLVQLVTWAQMETLHQITDAGRERLSRGAQYALDVQ